MKVLNFLDFVTISLWRDLHPEVARESSCVQYEYLPALLAPVIRNVYNLCSNSIWCAWLNGTYLLFTKWCAWLNGSHAVRACLISALLAMIYNGLFTIHRLSPGGRQQQHQQHHCCYPSSRAARTKAALDGGIRNRLPNKPHPQQTVLVRERLGGVGTGAPTATRPSEIDEVAADLARKAAANAAALVTGTQLASVPVAAMTSTVGIAGEIGSTGDSSAGCFDRLSQKQDVMVGAPSTEGEEQAGSFSCSTDWDEV